MKKIKRNKLVEKAIIMGAILPQMDEKTASEVIDGTVEEYKGNEGKKFFTAEETDAIMQVLQSMPGYSPEKLIVAGAPLSSVEKFPCERFEWQLYIVYIMLSITNPELFEDYEEADDGKAYKDALAKYREVKKHEVI